MPKIGYCSGYLKDFTYCPLADICYRCCDCEKERQLKRYGTLNTSFSQYDKKERTCPFYLNRAQWECIKLLSK